MANVTLEKTPQVWQIKGFDIHGGETKIIPLGQVADSLLPLMRRVSQAVQGPQRGGIWQQRIREMDDAAAKARREGISDSEIHAAIQTGQRIAIRRISHRGLVGKIKGVLYGDEFFITHDPVVPSDLPDPHLYLPGNNAGR